VLTLNSGGHTGIIQNVFITQNGDRVVTVGDDKAVRVWDIKTGTTVNVFRFPAGLADEGALKAAALSSKGLLAVYGTPVTTVAAKDKAKTVHPIFLMNVETGALVRTVNAAGSVWSLHFSSDGRRLAVGCASGTIQILDAATGGQQYRYELKLPINELRFSPDPQAPTTLAVLTSGAQVVNTGGEVVGSVGGQLHVVDVKTPAKNSRPFEAAAIKPFTIGWSNDAQFVAIGGSTGDIVVYDALNHRPSRTFPRLMNKTVPVQIMQLQYLAADNAILVGGSENWAGVIAADSGNVKLAFKAHSGSVTAVAASPGGKLVATSGGNQNETFVWNPTSGLISARLAGAGKGIWSIGWSMDGKSIGWGTKSTTQDANGNFPLEQIFRLDELGPGGPAFQTRFQQAQNDDDKIKIVRTPTFTSMGVPAITIGVMVGNQQPYAVRLSGDEVHSVSLLPGRGKAVLGGAHGLYMYNLQEKKVEKNFGGASGSIYSVAPSPDGKYFVTGSSDQTIRVWKPEEDEPLLSIFVTGREWIAWTPQGYYACSPHGENLLAWQINTTATRMPQVFPAAQFRASMYQPAVVKYLMPSNGKVEYAMAMAQKFDKALLQLTSVADVLPPEVSFEEALLKEKLVVDQDTLSVKASAKGSAKQPITAMRLMVDGRPFKGTSGVKRFDTPAETADASWDVPLSPGPHTFSVIAETTVSRGMTKLVTVTRSGEVPKPNLYVLAMGVSDYPAPVNKLPCAAGDAKRIGDAFTKYGKGVFANIEVKILMDKDASKKGIQVGLDWLASKMTAKDVGIVSFSGHGSRDENNKFYLVPSDVTSKDPFGSCFPGDEFKVRLDNMPGRLITILDACHSGDVAERVKPVSQDSLALDLSSEDSGVVVMSASLGREYSYESPAAGAGFFTLALAEGLEGWADIDGNGVIDIAELDQYAIARVRQLSQGRQNSMTSIPSSIRPFPLATVENPK
jgi:WD40 repeat protein